MINTSSRRSATPHSAISEQPRFESIDAWLAVFARLLPLSEEASAEIIGELEGHLRERVRDLMVAGLDESQALQTAVGELGDTAELAARFQHAHSYPKRRRIMHTALFTTAAGIIGIGAFTMVAPNPQVDFSVFQEAPQSPALAAKLDREIDASFEEATLNDVGAFLADTLDTNVVINRHDLEQLDIFPDEGMITLHLQAMPVHRVLRLIEEQINDDHADIVWHVDERLIELGVRDRFDRRDAELVAYDVTPILNTLWEEYDIEYQQAQEQIAQVLVEMVSSDDWEDMGGVSARKNFVGGRLFIEAPRRMHKQIAWILGELSDGRQVADGPFGPGTGDAFDPHLGAGLGVGSSAATTIKPGDTVRIEVFNLVQSGKMYATTQTIGGEQEVRLPGVGGVSTAGRSLGQLEDALRSELKSYLNNPLVTVYRPSLTVTDPGVGIGSGGSRDPLMTGSARSTGDGIGGGTADAGVFPGAGQTAVDGGGGGAGFGTGTADGSGEGGAGRQGTDRE